MAAITLEEVNKSLQIQNETLDRTEKGITEMSSNLSAFLTGMKSESLRQLEDDIEARRKGQQGDSSGISAGQAGLLGGIGAALAGLAGALSPIILGAVGSILAIFDETFNDISRTFASAFFGITDRIASLLRGVARLFTVDGAIGRLFKFDTLYIYFDDAMNFIKASVISLVGEDSRLIKFFRSIRNAFSLADDSPIMKLVDKFGGMFKTLGGILKKIFLPIGLIFTAYDTVKGVIEGYEEEGIVGGIVGGVTGFFKSVIGAPLNLLRDASAWILKQFGAEKIAEWLQTNFDFEKLFDEIGDALIAFVKSPIDTIKGWLQSIFGKATSEEAIAKDAADNPEIQELLNAPRFAKGTLGVTGQLFPDFGKGTLSILDGEEAVIPKNSGLGAMLGQIMERSNKAGFQKFAADTGSSLKAKENAMRAAGASDMEIAQSIMGDMPGIMGNLKGIGEKMDLGSIIPKAAPNNQLGNVFTSMVNESRENVQRQAEKQPAPVIIQDNSSRSSGVTNTAMPIQSTPYDFNDPFVKGLRMI